MAPGTFENEPSDFLSLADAMVTPQFRTLTSRRLPTDSPHQRVIHGRRWTDDIRPFLSSSNSVQTLSVLAMCSGSQQPLSAHDPTNLNTDAWLHDLRGLPRPFPVSDCPQMIIRMPILFSFLTLCLNNWENVKCLQYPHNHLRLDVNLWMSDLELGLAIWVCIYVLS